MKDIDGQDLVRFYTLGTRYDHNCIHVEYEDGDGLRRVLRMDVDVLLQLANDYIWHVKEAKTDGRMGYDRIVEVTPLFDPESGAFASGMCEEFCANCDTINYIVPWKMSPCKECGKLLRPCNDCDVYGKGKGRCTWVNGSGCDRFPLTDEERRLWEEAHG